MVDVVLDAKGLVKVFHQGQNRITVLDEADLQLARGEIVALVGPSGSGKTTLLQILGLLDHPDSGEIILSGQSMANTSDRVRTLARRNHIGFVYQHHNLLPECSALENIMLPQLILGQPKKAAKARAMELLEQMELADRASHRPAALSGGQQQRVAIARALANQPGLILADEPTGNLDPETASHVMDVMLDRARHHDATVLLVTHNLALAEQTDRSVTVKAGKLVAA